MATLSQQKAIKSNKRKVVVTASAGSGKTFTMIARVLSLVKEKRASLSNVVMLTFTEAAAQEMKTRLAAALIDEIKSATGEERAALVAALDALPLLHIGTIDSFCYRLVRSHFELLGISPLHALSDESVTDAYREKAIKEVLEEYAKEDEESYFSLLYSFGREEEDALSKGIQAIYAFAETTEDGDAFLDRAKGYAEGDPEELPCIKDFVREVAARAKKAIARIDELDPSFPDGAKNLRNRYAFILGALDSFAACRTLSDVGRARDKSALSGGLGNDSLNYPEATCLYYAVKDIYDDFRRTAFPEKPLIKGDAADLLADIRVANIETLRLIELTKRFKARYHAIKDEERALDFSDVEHGALTLLRDYGVAKEIGCRYLLVDESQDLNPLQDALMRLIAGKNDIFLVGDIKQSIYRFRLSDPLILRGWIEEGRRDLEGADVIDFSENFRSSNEVIGFVNTVFTHLMSEEFGGESFLPATRGGRTYGTGGVRAFFYPPEEAKEEPDGVYSVREAARIVDEEESRSKEGEWVRDRILELVGKTVRSTKDDSEYTLSYKDIAILSPKRARAGKEQEKVVSCLRRAGIPLNVGEFVQSEDHTEVRAIVDFLRLIESPMNDYALLSVLRSDLFGFTPDRLAEIALREGATFSARAMAAAAAGEEDVAAFYDYLGKMRFMSSTLSLYELVSLLIDEKMRLTVLNRSDGRKVFGELLTYAETLKEGKATASISEYLPWFDRYFKLSGEGDVSESDAVSLMTIHASKGMEFPVVFVIGLDDLIVSPMESKDRVRTDKEYGVIKEPAEGSGDKNLAVALYKRKKTQEVKEDRLRLLYVALTRAKNYLFLSGKLKEEERFLPKEKAKSFCQWVMGATAGKYPFETEYLPLPTVSRREDEKGGAPCSEEVAALKQAFDYRYPHERAMHTGIKYTVTSINEREEEGYYPPTLLFPEEKKAKGTAFHAAMEEIPFSLSSEEETAVFLDKLAEEGGLTAEEREDLSAGLVFGAMRRVSELVGQRRLYREKSFLLKLSAREAGVAEIDDQVQVQGKIDLVAIGEKDAVIVDYKLSGAPREVLIERYRAQLDLYALAVEKHFGVKAAKYIFVLGRNETIAL